VTEEQRKRFSETKELLSQQLVPEKNETKEQFEIRKKAFDEKKISAFKEILLQDVTNNRTNRNFMQYTKGLIKNYLQNPFRNQDLIREVSRYLYRVCTLYKKIILYYATMPTYNYNVTQKMDSLNDSDFDKMVKNYINILKKFQKIDFLKEFSTALALAQRDGVYCSYIYNLSSDSCFFHILDPKYYKIKGKNEDGQFIVYFDASFFSVGNNYQYVEGINGDTSSCWDQVFINGWNSYNEDKKNHRWFMLPSDKTLTLLANMDDELDLPLPFWCGIFVSLLDMLDYEQIIADKTELENYILLVSKIPLFDNGVVDDFKVSLEMVEAMQDLINAAVPALCGTAYAPFDIEKIDFSRSNSNDDTNMLMTSISNVFNMAGPPQLVVSGGGASQSTAIKQAIANDSSLAFLWVSRLEKNFIYYMEKHISNNYIFSIHRQTWFYMDEYINRLKDASTLGNAPMDYLTALGNTPYTAWNKLMFEKALGLRDLMIPLSSSYNSGGEAGRPTEGDLDNPESIATREGGKNEGTKDRKG